MAGHATTGRPPNWWSDLGNVADLIWWLYTAAPTYDYDDRKLFKVRAISDATEILHSPEDFGVEWAAFQQHKAERRAV